jgi:hypothetical protein
VPYDNKIEFQIAPPTDAHPSAKARHENFGVRGLTLAFTAQCPPHPRGNTLQLQTPHLKPRIANENPTRIVTLSDQPESKGRSFLLLKPAREKILIANPELEFLATHRKCGLLTFANRKKIAGFDPRLSTPFSEPKKLSSSLICPDDRSRRRRVARQHISNRNKNTHFAFPDSTNASPKSHTATREPRTTTRAAFRSTIPARPHAYR